MYVREGELRVSGSERSAELQSEVEEGVRGNSDDDDDHHHHDFSLLLSLFYYCNRNVLMLMF